MFTKDREFYREFFAMFWLLVMQNVVVLAVNLADNMMLGNYSGAAVGGAATVNQIQFLVQNVIASGIAEAVVVLSAQYWGQRRPGPIKSFSGIALRVSLSFALIMFALVSISPERAVGLFTTNSDYIKEGAAYLRIVRFTYPIFAVTAVVLATLRSVRTVRIAFLISLGALVINCGGNYLFIFGRFGLPRMGASGAAIGTLAARVVKMIAVLIYLFKVDNKLHAKPKEYLRIDRALVRDYARIAVPLIFFAFVWGANTAMQTFILGHIGADPMGHAIAANAVASNLMMMLKAASVGAASAAAIVIGNAVGRGDMRKLREYTRTLQMIFLCVGAVTFISLFLMRGLIPRVYTSLSPETLQMADSFLLVMCFTAAGMAYQMPVGTGIIRAGGDVRFCLMNDVASIFIIVLPLSLMAAFVLRWPPVAVVLCLNSDQIFKCLSNAIKCNRYTWIKNLTRTNA